MGNSDSRNKSSALLTEEQIDEWRSVGKAILQSRIELEEDKDPFEFYIERVKRQFQSDEEKFLDQFLHGYHVILQQIQENRKAPKK